MTETNRDELTCRARSALDELRRISQVRAEQEGSGNPRVQRALAVLDHEMDGQGPWEILDEPLFANPTLGDVLREELLTLECGEWETIDDGNDGPESNQPDHDPHWADEPLTDDQEALGTTPQLLGLLRDLRENIKPDYESLQGAALQLENSMGEETRDLLSNMARQALLAQAETEKARWPRE